MSAAHIDRISAGYALPFTEQIKYAIRTMPYGDFMDMALAIGADTSKMWGWASASLKDEKEQTEEERTSVSGGIYAP